jgi:hypothetical protein
MESRGRLSQDHRVFCRPAAGDVNLLSGEGPTERDVPAQPGARRGVTRACAAGGRLALLVAGRQKKPRPLGRGGEG